MIVSENHYLNKIFDVHPLAINVNGNLETINSNLGPVNVHLGPVNGAWKKKQFAVIIGILLFLPKTAICSFFY